VRIARVVSGPPAFTTDLPDISEGGGSCSGRMVLDGEVNGEWCVPSAAEYLDEATRGATDWREDAYLSAIDAGAAPATLEGACPHGHVIYSFHSPSTPREFYMAVLWRGAWTSDTHPLGSMEVPSLPIERDEWILDSVDAWRIAQAEGGKDLVRRYGDSDLSILVQLDRFRVGSADDVLVWRVDYGVRPHVPGGHLDILMDPKSGDVLEVIAD
jgi:hypothetical protein